VRQGRRAEFGSHGWADLYGAADADFVVPDPQDPASFAASLLDWSERDRPEHARMFDWYRRLIALRREVPDLGSGDRAATRLEFPPDAVADGPWQDWLVLHRGRARVAINLAAHEQEVPIGDARGLTVRASWSGCTIAHGTAVLPPGGTAILA
jgi:maltooligosyltrehalose trehalohydrolase